MAESRIVVYGALAGNTAIAVTKFIVAGITGSSAMLSEAIHSSVDTADSVLLLVGLKQSRRGPDPDHPFGHGKELYFWSLIVAVMIFGAGGGVSMYEGVLHILHPEPMRNPIWNYIVLGVAAVFEGISFGIGLHAVLKEKGETPFWTALRNSKDPATFTVVAEDGAALAGLAMAAIGIYLSRLLDMPVLDGAASIAIGALLVVVALLLVYESRSLLVGEGVSRQTAETIRRLAAADEAVASVDHPLTMYIGPDNVLLNLDIEFKRGVPGDGVAASVERIERAIRTRFPRIRRIYIEATHLAATGGRLPKQAAERSRGA